MMLTIGLCTLLSKKNSIILLVLLFERALNGPFCCSSVGCPVFASNFQEILIVSVIWSDLPLLYINGPLEEMKRLFLLKGFWKHHSNSSVGQILMLWSSQLDKK